MTDILSAAEAISRIPGLKLESATYRSIKGGLTNRTFLVKADDRTLILRLDAGHTEKFGLNRAAELAILKQAATREIAPDVVFADADAGILVYEYLPGRCWIPADLEDRGNLESVARLIRTVHALPKSGVAFDAPGAGERYVAAVRQNGELYSFALRCREIIAGIPLLSDTRCCHNDVVAANIVATPHLRLIDWEYACDNDPYFDLATLAGYHDLSDEQAKTLLGAYTGKIDPESWQRLQLQRRLYDAIQWLWLAVRQTVMPDNAHGERLRQLAGRVR